MLLCAVVRQQHHRSAQTENESRSKRVCSELNELRFILAAISLQTCSSVTLCCRESTVSPEMHELKTKVVRNEYVHNSMNCGLFRFPAPDSSRSGQQVYVLVQSTSMQQDQPSSSGSTTRVQLSSQLIHLSPSAYLASLIPARRRSSEDGKVGNARSNSCEIISQVIDTN